MDINEAKALINEEAIEHLKKVITNEEKIDTSTKLNGDAIMIAFCDAINNSVIKPSSLSEMTIKMLNSSTQSISQSKLGEILDYVHKNQPNIVCDIKIIPVDGNLPIQMWRFESSKDCKFNSIFEFVVTEFKITPSMVREQLSKLLKPTIANNIGQFVAKYQSSTHKDELVVSITTIARLANMCGYKIICEFKNEK
jgi:hypothetical protein